MSEEVGLLRIRMECGLAYRILVHEEKSQFPHVLTCCRRKGKKVAIGPNQLFGNKCSSTVLGHGDSFLMILVTGGMKGCRF